MTAKKRSSPADDLLPWLRLLGILAVLVVFPVVASARCVMDTPGRLWDYAGDIDGHPVRMTLTPIDVDGGTADHEGVYFYTRWLRDIRLSGSLVDDEQGTEIRLDERDASGKVSARFRGRFAHRDPRGGFGGSVLQCEVIVGTWQRVDGDDTLPFYLRLDGSHMGTLERRYGIAGADDDAVVERGAQRFRDAVKANDKAAVATMIRYPIRVRIDGERISIGDRSQFIARYEQIFSERYRAAVLQAVPHNMSASYKGVMLGDAGEIWLDAEGRVIALNNF